MRRRNVGKAVTSVLVPNPPNLVLLCFECSKCVLVVPIVFCMFQMCFACSKCVSVVSIVFCMFQMYFQSVCCVNICLKCVKHCLFCVLHLWATVVIYYSTHTRKNVIYLLNTKQQFKRGKNPEKTFFLYILGIEIRDRIVLIAESDPKIREYLFLDI